jgi:hypothetical protein
MNVEVSLLTLYLTSVILKRSAITSVLLIPPVLNAQASIFGLTNSCFLIMWLVRLTNDSFADLGLE